MISKIYPVKAALEAMAWGGAERYLRHRTGKKVFASDLGARTAKHVGPNKIGPGETIHFTADAIVQGAIALRLIDCGCDVAHAYRIGAAFAYQGDMRGPAMVTFGDDAPAELVPALDRMPGKLFGAGQTLLIWCPDTKLAAGQEAFRIVSTADPAIPEGTASQVYGTLALFAGGGDDSAPRVIIDLSALCLCIARRLHASARDLFGYRVE